MYYPPPKPSQKQINNSVVTCHGMVTTMQAAELYNEWQFHIDTESYDGTKITKENLLKWAEQSGKLICIFCGNTGSEVQEWRICHACKEYKGIVPNIET